MKLFLLGSLSTLLLLCFGGWLVLVLGIYPVNADVDEYWLEKKVAHMAVSAHVKKQVQGLQNPIATVTPRILMAGMKTFKRDCEGCHGSASNKDATFANSLYPKAPHFGPDGIDDPVEELFWITKHGIRLTGMPGFRSMLSDDEIWELAVFMRNIDNLPPEVQSAWESQ